MAKPRHSLETIGRALEFVPPDCDRDTWWRMLAAVKSELGEEALELAKAWSARGASFRPDDFASTWRSLNTTGGVTIGSLFALATENGFTLNKGRDQVPNRAKDRAPVRRNADQAAREERERRERRQAKGAIEAARLFEAAGITGRSDYLERKQVRGHGTRFADDGMLLVPMRDIAGELRNLQAIAPGGDKRFLQGAQVLDCLHWLGDPMGATRLAIAEGYATAASIHEATGYPVACAFTAGNLPHVALAVRRAFPYAELIICADDDQATADRSGNNPGVRAARAAARDARAGVAIPSPLKPGETDFNDLARRAGAPAVAAAVQAAVVMMAAAPASSETTETSPTGATRDPFQVDDRGVWHLRIERDRTFPEWVCAPLEVLAQTRDADGAAWGYLIRYADPEGTIKTIAIPARLFATDGAELRSRLLDDGLAIAAGPARSRLAQFIATRRPGRFVHCVESIGWHGDAFVLPHRSFGPGTDDVFYQTADERPKNNFRSSGTLDQWRAGIASRCVGNPHLAFSVAIAIAGPCVHLVDSLSGGFHFYGPSSKGKTTAIRVGASVWGRPEVGANGFIRGWRATANALEATAASHSDTALFLDEMREAQPSEIAGAALMLGNGAGKARMRANGTARAQYSWRLLYISTGERTMAEQAALAQQTIDAGASVRLVEIPIPESGVFADLHGVSDHATFADELRAAALQNYGTSGVAWLEYLTAHRDEARTFLLDAARELADEMLMRATDAGQLQRVAGRFALVGAAGELATRAGITGWPPGEAEHAARLLFADWVTARGTRGDAEELAAVRQVAALLGQHAESYFPWWHRGADDHRPNAPKRWGLRKLIANNGSEINNAIDRDVYFGDGEPNVHEADGTEAEFFVLASAFRYELAKGFDPKYVADTLRRRGHLEPESEKRMDRKERLPGIGPARVYRIRPTIFNDDAI